MTATAHEIDVNKTRPPAFYCKQIGSPVVTAHSDCSFDRPFDLFPVLDPAQKAKRFRASTIASANSSQRLPARTPRKTDGNRHRLRMPPRPDHESEPWSPVG
jgi:hypothetical protein